jgi:hypothetical protein
MIQCNSVEQFQTETASAGPVTDFVTPGVKATLSVPAEAANRYIWIACGSYFQFAKADHWFIQGRINFFLRTTQVGFLEFSDASAELDDAERLIAPRTVTRISASGDGSYQPVLRFQKFSDAAYYRDNLDIPCLSVRVECDRIEYDLEKSYCATSGAFLIGLRCVSHP